MSKRYFLAVLVCLSCVLAGCGSHTGPEGSAEGSAAISGTVPSVPSGMRLGAAYISALNESCYELTPLSGTLEPTQALCLRDNRWQTAPSVLTVLPGRFPVPIR